MDISTFSFEKELAEKGYNFVIGVDEAGRGPLCGPVVACAVALRNLQFPIYNFQSSSNNQKSNEQKPKTTNHELRTTEMWDLVRDSKKLSEKQREKVFDFIQENFYVGVGLCNHETIDRINILEASFLAMKKAVQDLQRNIKKENTKYDIQNTRYMILVDGNKIIPNFSMEQKAVIG